MFVYPPHIIPEREIETASHMNKVLDEIRALVLALVLALMLSRSSFKHVFEQTTLLSLHRVLNKQNRSNLYHEKQT